MSSAAPTKVTSAVGTVLPTRSRLASPSQYRLVKEITTSGGGAAYRVRSKQRYEAVMAVVRDGRQVSEVDRVYGVTRQTMHAWVKKYDALGMGGLLDASRRPRRSPGQTSPEVEATVCELRRRHPAWGPRRISHELTAQRFPVSRASVYRVLVRQHLIVPGTQKRRPSDYKRWSAAGDGAVADGHRGWSVS